MRKPLLRVSARLAPANLSPRIARELLETKPIEQPSADRPQTHDETRKGPHKRAFSLHLGYAGIAYARRPTAALTARAQMTAATSFARSTRMNGATPAAKAAAGVMEATAMSCAQPHT